jgi:hypothetical protein
MKIILSESQYKNLFESKEEKKSDLLYSMWVEGMSMDDIKDYTGMNIQQIIYYLKNKEMDIDCKFAEDLVITLMFNTDFINKNYNFNDGQMFLNLNWGGSGGSVAFEFNDKDYFENKKTDEYADEYGSTGNRIENTPSSFNSIQELIDFLNNDYPKQLIKPIKELIEDYL